MFDISAFLSLKPAAPGIDPAAGQGMDVADIQAFGAILASQASGQAGAASPSLALPAVDGMPLPVAGERQAGGNILPDGLPSLPQGLPATPKLSITLPAVAATSAETAQPSAETPDALPVIPALPAIIVGKIAIGHGIGKALDTAPGKGLDEILTDRMDGQNPPAPTTAQLPAAVLPRPVVVAAAKRPAEGQTAPIVDDETPEIEAEDAEGGAPTLAIVAEVVPVVVSSAIPAEIVIPVELLNQRNPAPDEFQPEAASPRAAALPLQTPASPVATSVVALAAPQVANAPQQKADRPAAQSAAQPADAAKLAPLPVLTIEATTEAPAATATIVVQPAQTTAPSAPAGTRFRIATGAAKADENAAERAPASAPLAVRSVAEVETPITATFQPATPAAESLQPQLQQSAHLQAPGHLGHAAGQPGHDFAGLMDRLIQARDAAAPQSVNAAVHHAEFGQVSLQFQQDAGGLTVAMSSPDPDFTPAVQAAQAAASADRGNTQNDGSSQNQNPSQYQPGGNATLAQGNARDQGAEGQARAAQERNSRLSNNPSQTAGEEAAKPDRRSGIFA